MRKIIFASNNTHKTEEINALLQMSGIAAIPMGTAGITGEPDENGITFSENAYIKARYVYDRLLDSELPVIADDSGLEVDFLNGAPGIHSKRYAGEDATDEQRCGKLLEELSGVPAEKRTARFVCIICCIFPGGEVKYFKGTCEGYIAFKPQGKNGFGYDPVFKPRFVFKSCLDFSRSRISLPLGIDTVGLRDKFLCSRTADTGIMCGKSFAELTEWEKNKISHRCKAVQKLTAEMQMI
ncbi:MAG: non-canonical purine NTP pyrophosphatase [Oscillospiraceae bacterium]|jgi:XTP/dITP diphosphohydrolase|nr:non-canonical purine NTP pyrophosphatase [Oscillospiraceae bacterium]